MWSSVCVFVATLYSTYTYLSSLFQEHIHLLLCISNPSVFSRSTWRLLIIFVSFCESPSLCCINCHTPDKAFSNAVTMSIIPTVRHDMCQGKANTDALDIRSTACSRWWHMQCNKLFMQKNGQNSKHTAAVLSISRFSKNRPSRSSLPQFSCTSRGHSSSDNFLSSANTQIQANYAQ